MEDNKEYSFSSNKKKKFFHLDINPSDSSLKKFFLVLFSYIDSLIVLNVLFIVLSLGIITLGPALLATSHSMVNITNNKSEKIYTSFFKYFKEYFKLPYILFGLVLSLLLAGTTYLSFFFFENIFEYQVFIVPWILMIFLVLYLIDAFSCFILFVIRSNLPIRTCLTNGLKLSIGSLKYSLFCTLSFSFLFITPLIFIERTFILFIIIEFTLTILGCLLSVYSLVDKYIIYPSNEEEIQNKKDIKDFDIEVDLTKNNIKEETIDDEPNYDYSNSDSEEVL